MRSWRLIAWFPIVWTLAMGLWLVLYQQTHATCGPEIERNCSIGLSLTAGLGRPGIVLLWALGVVAYGLTLLTDRHLRSKGVLGPRKAGRHALPSAAMLTVVVSATAGVALPASTRPTPEGPPTASEAVDVRVVSAILHPSASSAGRNRHAARVSVHVRVHNRGSRRVTLPEPMLLSGDQALRYDSRQFRLKPLKPGVAVDARLRFEPRSAFTQSLVTERDARLQIAGQTIPLTLKIGAPVRKSPLRGVPLPRKTDRPSGARPPTRAPTPAPAARRRPRPPAPRAQPRIGPPPPAPRPRVTPSPPPPPPASRDREPAGTSFDDSA